MKLLHNFGRITQLWTGVL